jgi:hypothetical protein
MLKSIIKSLFIVGIFLFLTKPAFAAEMPPVATNGAMLHLFWAAGCPHCAKEKVFLDTLGKKYPKLTIKEYEVTLNHENSELLQKVGTKLKIEVSGVPFTVVCGNSFSGYLDHETTGKEIEEAVLSAFKDKCEDPVAKLLLQEKNSNQIEKQSKSIPQTLYVPILGELQVKNLSLPVLTFVIALLDGFNPCAMWTLLFLISLLLGMKDKKRRWILGSAFIIASAFVYFLFMATWLNILLFIGFIIWIRILIGLVALAGGTYGLKEFFFNKEAACKVTGGEKRQAVFEKLRDITHRKHLLIALGGIILLAFAVNLVELICSAGLPAVFTQILALSKLSQWQYYFYMLFYILIFMLDDLFVFITAMVTLEITGISTKYSRASHLIGGVLMLIIGLLLLFRPEWLMFG